MAVRSRCINSFQDRGGGRRFSFRALSALLCAATASCMFLDAREQQGRLAETCDISGYVTTAREQPRPSVGVLARQGDDGGWQVAVHSVLGGAGRWMFAADAGN